MQSIFTFWEGEMSAYIQLCLKTWKFPYTLLNWNNLNQYMDIDADIKNRLIEKFSLAQIADYIRVHVLLNNGGYWLDADTIMINNTLPTETMIGNNEARTNTIGYLHTIKNSRMFSHWAEYQDAIVLASDYIKQHWSLLANLFSDYYVKRHPSITIADVTNSWPETYMIQGDIPRYDKYQQFYFNNSYNLSDINDTNMLMLHNSWTPNWYKQLNEHEVLARNCTLSNILRETI